MVGAPITPKSNTNPVGQTERISKTVNAVFDAIDGVEVWLNDRLGKLPVQKILVNALYVNKYRYEYQISIAELEQIINELQIQLDEIPAEFVRQQVLDAYENGTGLANINLANISADYTRSITQVLLSEPYSRRAALVGARVFEEMKGFEAETGRDLAFILRGAVQDGLAPRDVSEAIAKRFDISRSRADRIAQTEITGALRRGRWDEAQDANTRLGIKTKLLWISALKPTTRPWHAQRQAQVYTIQEVREFYAVNGNAIYCYCSQTEVLVDGDGIPLPSSDRVILRLKKSKAAYFESKPVA